LKRLFTIVAVFIISFFFCGESHAQKRKVMNLRNYNQQPYHFGFILAANQMNFTLKTIDNLPNIKWTGNQLPEDPGLVNADYAQVLNLYAKPTPGFTIGILGSLLLHEYIDMRFTPSLSFGERILTYDILSVAGSDSLLYTVDKNISSTLVEFPLDFKYRSKRVNNFDAYVMAGVNYTLDLASQKKAEQNSNTTTVKINKNDLTIDVGVGIDFYTQYFKFGVELKMAYGLFNLIKKEDNLYTNSIESLHSKIFQLSFTFE
jgi:hypothetical protein